MVAFLWIELVGLFTLVDILAITFLFCGSLAIFSAKFLQLRLKASYWAYNLEVSRVLVYVLRSNLKGSPLKIEILVIFIHVGHIFQVPYVSSNNLTLILCLWVQCIPWILACYWRHVLPMCIHLVWARQFYFVSLGLLLNVRDRISQILRFISFFSQIKFSSFCCIVLLLLFFEDCIWKAIAVDKFFQPWSLIFKLLWPVTLSWLVYIFLPGLLSRNMTASRFCRILLSSFIVWCFTHSRNLREHLCRIFLLFELKDYHFSNKRLTLNPFFRVADAPESPLFRSLLILF